MVMALYANGGIWVKVSFFILTPLWWYFTFKGYTAIRKKKVQEHKIWMMRSYALTLSAISLRGYQFFLGAFPIIDPAQQYILVSWLSWIGNLFLLEIYLCFAKKIDKSNFHVKEYLLSGKHVRI